MRLLESGPAAWLVEVDGGSDAVSAWAAAIRTGGRDDIAEVVPAATTVLVELVAGADRDRVAAWLRALEPGPVEAPAGTAVEIEVVYDGPDLAAVAAECQLSIADVVERHSAPTYRCGFCGFAPGFAYLSGLDPALQLPRRSTPRTCVPAGSVAIAAEYTAVYPTESPAGWHVIGRTAAVLFDPGREPLALVAPGASVRFIIAGG